MKFCTILAIFVVASVMISVLGLSRLDEFNSGLQEIVDKSFPRIILAKELDGTTHELKDLEKTLLLATDAEEFNKAAAELEVREKVVRERIQKLTVLFVTVESKAAIVTATSHLDAWHASTDEVKKLLKFNKPAEAYAIVKRAGSENLDKFDEIMDQIVTRNVNILVETKKKNDTNYQNSRNLISLVSIGSILLGIILSFFVLRKLNLTLNNVVDGLSESASQVTSAAQQIAASSQELSQGATEQASSLEETSSAVEEMNSMVQKNADSAQVTLTNTMASGESATRGKKVVDEMKGAMKAIDAANVNIVDQIKDSSTMLSEIVKLIGEIGNKTKVINDIVFQTKLLSFNASVEAARAGEHGKGFAVVAEEVGNLAQMSGNAAKEISSMLESSIQKVEGIVKLTNASVEKLAADSKAKVEVGNRVADECGTVLEDIVAKVSVVQQMSHSIATASNEQARGVSEINKAVTQLDQMTQQNAAVSEEAASAAEELSSQAESMQGIVQALIHTIKGGKPSEQSSALPVRSPSHSAPKVTRSEPVSTGNVVRLGSKTPNPAPNRTKEGPAIRLVSGGDTVPTENDPRFKDI